MPTPIERIAVAVPPAHWFHGIDRALFDLYRSALVELGLEVFDVPVDAFLPPDAVRLARLIPEILAFRPQLIVGLPHGSYALICRMAAERDGWRPNLFTDVLDIPTVCMWEHAPLEMADQLLSPHPKSPGESKSGAMDALGQVLTHPRMVHWSRDSGQTRLMEKLGFAAARRVIHDGTPGLPGFEGAAPASLEGVAFIGHIYPAAETYRDPDLASLASDTINSWWERPQAALWDVLESRIAAMPQAVRSRLALGTDQTYFWRFTHRLITQQAQTTMRLKTLAAAGVPVICYGNFEHSAKLPGNLIERPGGFSFGPELAEVFTRHAITIDVLNPGSIAGYSHKPLMGFASGGFVLVNRKQDFVANFGAAGEAASYGDSEELGRKIEYFLAHPKERLEVGQEIRERIRTRFQLRDVLSRMLMHAAELAGELPASPKLPIGGAGQVVVRDMLSEVRVESPHSGATVKVLRDGVHIATPSAAWAYAAVVKLPGKARRLKEPHVRMRLWVETGRVGISAVLKNSAALLAEQVVSRNHEPVTVTLELPREAAGVVIIRNTVDGVSRAVVLEAALCDRK